MVKDVILSEEMFILVRACLIIYPEDYSLIFFPLERSC